MKKLYTILFSVIVIFFCTSCGKDLNENGSREDNQNEKDEQLDGPYENQDELMEQFVQSILDSTYTLYYIPYFNPEAITPLLEYADDFSPVYYFPQSGLSSYYLHDKKLGECLLWTIECIRVRYPFKDNLHQFVSSIPLLVDKKFLEDVLTIPGVDRLDYRLNDQQLHEVYEVYRKWWESYNHENFEEIRKINLLENLNYVWL